MQIQSFPIILKPWHQAGLFFTWLLLSRRFHKSPQRGVQRSKQEKLWKSIHGQLKGVKQPKSTAESSGMGTRRLREAEDTAPLRATKPRLDQKNKNAQSKTLSEDRGLSIRQGAKSQKDRQSQGNMLWLNTAWGVLMKLIFECGDHLGKLITGGLLHK